MSITPLPSAPAVTDTTAEFNSKAFAWVAALDDFTTETNALAAQVDADAVTAAEGAAASEAAVAAANYKGEWSSLTGALNIPASVSHNGSVYVLTANLANVTTDEPGVTPSSKWIVVTIPPQTGNSGKFLTTNGTDLSWAAVEAGTYKATASGSLANGDKVIVNSDGTVSAIVGSSETAFNSGTATFIASAYDSTNNKIVVAFSDGGNSSKGTAVVGTISGTTISFGTEVLFNNATTNDIGITFDSTNSKIVISYRDGGNSSYGTAIVGTVSGTSISFGSPVVYESAASYINKSCFDTTNGKVFIVWHNASGGAGAAAGVLNGIVGSVSGTSISFGSKTSNGTANFGGESCAFDSVNSKILIVCANQSDSYNLRGIVATISGTSVSFGTIATTALESGGTNVAYDATAGKFIAVYSAYSGGGYVSSAITATISGTNVTFGSASSVGSSITSINVAYDPSMTKCVIFYPSTEGKYSYVTVSGTSVSIGTASTFATGTVSSIAPVYATTSGKMFIGYSKSPNASSIMLTNGGVTNLTSSNFIGISSAAYTNGQTAVIQTVGSVDDAQSGLTAGSLYYVLPSGTLSTTAGAPSVIAGTAVSATKIIIKG